MALIQRPLLATEKVGDWDAYRYLQENFPEHAEAVEIDVKAGKSPDDIYRHWMARHGRELIGKRLRSAAEYLITNGALQ